MIYPLFDQEVCDTCEAVDPAYAYKEFLSGVGKFLLWAGSATMLIFAWSVRSRWIG